MELSISKKLEALVGSQITSEKELLLKLKGIVYELESQVEIVRPSKSLSELFSEGRLAHEEENPFGSYKTSFTDFDNDFGGFFLGEFIVIGGRPSMGKTQLLVNLAVNLSKQVPVLFFTFDLSPFLLTNRIISHLTQISIDKILNQQLTIEEQSIIAGLEQEISSLNIHINESGSNSVSGLKNLCEKHIKEDGVKVIFVDYLQLMSTSRYKNNRELEVGFISRELKNIAKD